MREYMRIAVDDDLRTRREKVTGRVLALDRKLQDTRPYLLALLGLSEGDDALAQMIMPLSPTSGYGLPSIVRRVGISSFANCSMFLSTTWCGMPRLKAHVR
jgi:hypothetical protein